MDTPSESDAAAYFEAKLKFETTPFTLDYNIRKEKVLVVDPRERADWEEAHIPGAVSIPLGELEARARELPKDKTVVVYGWHSACAFGPKAALALARLGLRVQMLTGGFERWKSKFPIESAKPQ